MDEIDISALPRRIRPRDGKPRPTFGASFHLLNSNAPQPNGNPDTNWRRHIGVRLDLRVGRKVA